MMILMITMMIFMIATIQAVSYQNDDTHDYYDDIHDYYDDIHDY